MLLETFETLLQLLSFQLCQLSRQCQLCQRSLQRWQQIGVQHHLHVGCLYANGTRGMLCQLRI